MDCIHALNIPHTLLLYEGQYPKISKSSRCCRTRRSNETHRTFCAHERSCMKVGKGPLQTQRISDPFFIWKVANQTRKTGTLSSP